MEAHFDIYLMCLEVFWVNPNHAPITPKPQPRATGPHTTLGLHCSLEARARKGPGEQPCSRDMVQLSEHQHRRELPACHPQTPLDKIFRGDRAHRTPPPPTVLGTRSAFSLHQPTCPCPCDKPRGLTALPAACVFHPGLFLHPQISPLYLTLLPLGSKAQMAHSSLRVNVQGEGAAGNNSNSSAYFIGVKCLSDVLKGP